MLKILRREKWKEFVTWWKWNHGKEVDNKISTLIISVFLTHLLACWHTSRLDRLFICTHTHTVMMCSFAIGCCTMYEIIRSSRRLKHHIKITMKMKKKNLLRVHSWHSFESAGEFLKSTNMQTWKLHLNWKKISAWEYI